MVLSLPLLIIGSMLMLAGHIILFKSFPSFIRKLLAGNLFLGTAADLGISTLLMFFTGPGNIIGLISIISSVLFVGYIVAYRRVHEIGKMRLKWKFKIVPVVEIQENNRQHWLF